MTTVLVTGANRGLGLEFVRQYAKDGAKVIACAREPSRADALQKLAKDNDKIDIRALDTSDFKACAALGKQVAGEPIDIVINNAGYYGPKKQSVDEMDFDGWAYTLAVNTMGPLAVAQALHGNLKRGKEKKLITITSGMASTAETEGGYLAYRASKAAVNNVMRNVAIGWRGEGIISVVLSPGWVRTDMGGASAPLSPEESVSAMRKIIAGLKLADSGKFLSHRGHEVAW
jgi:NAD(P)-dependent dehydrogenase (short-subunit alcohol dehydrogenase family)